MIFRWLNNNMRCFEIVLTKIYRSSLNELNNNMRCFEIYNLKYIMCQTKKLNNNMRCFEIGYSFVSSIGV